MNKKISVTENILESLKILGEKQGKQVSIEGDKSTFVVFHFGDDTAAFHIDVQPNANAESGMKAVGSIESWEYKHKEWWREVLKNLEAKLIFLDPPVAWVASDGGLTDTHIFRPQQIINNLHLEKANKTTTRKLKEATNAILMNVLSPIIAPHYLLAYHHGALRLTPETPEARASLTSDNDVYIETARKIASSAKIIEEQYEHIRI